VLEAFYQYFEKIFQFQPTLSETFRSAYDFAEVTFKRDFGPWKKGHRAELLCLDLDSMELSEFDTKRADENADGLPVYKKSCKLTFIPEQDLERLYEQTQRKPRNHSPREPRKERTNST
jgi:hypothetical protein